MARRSDDSVWQKLRAKMRGLENAHVRVGIFGTEAHDGHFLMVELAAVHEFGSSRAGIPERSFIRRTFKEQEHAAATVIARVAKAIVTDKITVEHGLDILGTWGADQVKRTVTQGTGVPPPLAQSTIDRKGSTRPLVDTGRLINAVTHKVVLD